MIYPRARAATRGFSRNTLGTGRRRSAAAAASIGIRGADVRRSSRTCVPRNRTALLSTTLRRRVRSCAFKNFFYYFYTLASLLS